MQNDIKNDPRSLGPKEATVALSLREHGRSVVTVAEIGALLDSPATTRKVIFNLRRKGWLTQLKRGRYLFLPPEYGPTNLGENNPLALAAAVVEPSYVGWWSAASFHGLTTQRPVTITVATRRQLPSRTIEGNEIRFITVVARKFFGFQTYDVYGRQATLSTPAKTVVDCIDRPDLAGGASEVARIVYGASSVVSPEEVADVALQVDSLAAVQRLGFLADLVGWKWPDAVRLRLRSAIHPSRRSHFGRKQTKPGDLGYVAAWGLFVRASEDELLADVPRGKKESA